MMREYEILDVHAIEILDALGIPTLDVTVTLKDGITGSASVPGGYPVVGNGVCELRDGDRRHCGMGVLQAVTNVNTRIADKIIGMNVLEQVKIDRMLLKADGTDNRRKYGANAILGVSLACARAASNALGVPLYRYLGGTYQSKLPVPMINVINGGEDIDNTLDFKEFMIVPVDADGFSHSMEMGCEIYHYLKKIIQKDGLSKGVGCDGGIITDLESHGKVLDMLMEAIENAGYTPGTDIMLAFNADAGRLYDEKSDMYYFSGESKRTGKEMYRNAEEMVQYYEDIINRYPVYLIEDALGAEDTKGWELLTYRLGKRVLLAGNELFATNTKRLMEGIDNEIANSVVINYNQTGTVTELMEVIETAKNSGYRYIINQCLGETEDGFVADIAVAASSELVKFGAPCRSDRTSKYNRLLKIEYELGKDINFGYLK